jgi:hypothetical protein
MLRDEPGQQALLDRLLDVALVQMLRELFTAGAGCAGLVQGIRRCARRRGAACRARRTGAPLDGGRPRGRGGPVALSLRPAVHRTARARAARLPDRVADGPRARALARHRRSARPGRPIPSATARSSRSRPRSSATTALRPAAGGRRRARPRSGLAVETGRTATCAGA